MMTMSESIREAVEVLLELAQDTNTSDEIRLEAARTILSYAVDIKEKNNG